MPDYGEPSPPTPLQEALRDVFGMACQGHPPGACAVVYRKLSRDFPHARNLMDDYAERWERLGQWWAGEPGERGNLFQGTLPIREYAPVTFRCRECGLNSLRSGTESRDLCPTCYVRHVESAAKVGL